MCTEAHTDEYSAKAMEVLPHFTYVRDDDSDSAGGSE